MLWFRPRVSRWMILGCWFPISGETIYSSGWFRRSLHVGVALTSPKQLQFTGFEKKNHTGHTSPPHTPFPDLLSNPPSSSSESGPFLLPLPPIAPRPSSLRQCTQGLLHSASLPYSITFLSVSFCSLSQDPVCSSSTWGVTVCLLFEFWSLLHLS